jgi:uncharacterized protein (DUF1330 family)
MELHVDGGEERCRSGIVAHQEHQKISALDGTPPKRFVIIGFESVDKAKAWDASAAQKEVNDIRMKNTKSRSFIVAVEGM